MLGARTLPGAAGAADAAPSQPGVTVVARGFNGPFGIAFGPKGLYVAESDAGKVTTANLGSGAQSTYLRGLTSVTGVSVASTGTVWAVTGETGRPGPRSTRLYRAPHPGHATVVANLLAYEHTIRTARARRPRTQGPTPSPCSGCPVGRWSPTPGRTTSCN